MEELKVAGQSVVPSGAKSHWLLPMSYLCSAGFHGGADSGLGRG